LGIKSAPLHTLYPASITTSLTHAFTTHFPSQSPGFLSPSGILHGVETRTSSPLRVPRDKDTMETSLGGLYAAGEGAGYAGGIVSAAVDGWRVGEILDRRIKEEVEEEEGC